MLSARDTKISKNKQGSYLKKIIGFERGTRSSKNDTNVCTRLTVSRNLKEESLVPGECPEGVFHMIQGSGGS